MSKYENSIMTSEIQAVLKQEPILKVINKLCTDNF